MFTKKYMFETQHTRYLRYIKNIFLIIFFSFTLYSLCCLLFILVSNNENQITQEHFFQKAPDLIAVFTGDSGRISYAISQAMEYKQSQIFITGVYAKNTVKSLLIPYKEKGSNLNNRLTIDYSARNTIGNIVSTVKYLNDHKTIKTIVIISHDYHIMRIKLIMNKLKASTNEKHTFFYKGISTNYLNFRNIKILYKEVFKFIRLFVIPADFWDEARHIYQSLKFD